MSDLVKRLRACHDMLQLAEPGPTVEGEAADYIEKLETRCKKAEKALLDNSGAPMKPGERIPLHYFAEYQKAKTELERLTRERDETYAKAIHEMAALRESLVASQTSNARLREAIDKYGHHLDWCTLGADLWKGWAPGDPVPVCTCGLALAASLPPESPTESKT